MTTVNMNVETSAIICLYQQFLRPELCSKILIPKKKCFQVDDAYMPIPVNVGGSEIAGWVVYLFVSNGKFATKHFSKDQNSLIYQNLFLRSYDVYSEQKTAVVCV